MAAAEQTWNAFLHLDALVLQAIILFVILWVLNKYLFKPYLKYLDEYEKKQAKIEKDYKNIDKLVKDAEDKKEKILKKARKKGDEIISESESLGSSKRDSIIEKAEKDATNLVEVSKGEIEKERLSMLNGVKSQLVDLILKFNWKLFGEEKISKEYIEQKIDSIK